MWHWVRARTESTLQQTTYDKSPLRQTPSSMPYFPIFLYTPFDALGDPTSTEFVDPGRDSWRRHFTCCLKSPTTSTRVRFHPRQELIAKWLCHLGFLWQRGSVVGH